MSKRKTKPVISKDDFKARIAQIVRGEKPTEDAALFYRKPLLSKWWQTASCEAAFARAKSKRDTQIKTMREKVSARRDALEREIFGNNNKPVGGKTTMKNNGKTKTVVAAKTPATKTTKTSRTLVFGFPVTAVCRKLGALKWEVSKALEAVLAINKNVSPTTVRIQVAAGRNGERGEPASLTAKHIAELEAAIGRKVKATTAVVAANGKKLKAAIKKLAPKKLTKAA